MGRAHGGVKVPSGSRAVEKLVKYPMEAESAGAHTTPMEINPIFGSTLAPVEVDEASMKVAGRFPWNMINFHGS